jgi:hypothetical protein
VQAVRLSVRALLHVIARQSPPPASGRSTAQKVNSSLRIQPALSKIGRYSDSKMYSWWMFWVGLDG